MKRKINVMHVSYGMGIGGMEKVITDLCRHMNGDKYQSMICCTNLKGEFGQILEKEGYRIFLCAQNGKYEKYLRLLEVAKLLKRNRIDIVHSHSVACVEGVMGGVLARTPVRIHTDHCKNYPTNWRYMRSEKIASYFADRFVAVSNHTKKDLVQWENISPDKIQVIYNGMNFGAEFGKEDHERILQELGLKPHQRVIGSVGRIEYQKGYDLLVDSAKEILDRHPETRFVIVGGGSKEEELRIQIRRLNLERHFILTGWRVDAPLILSTFDIFVMTSNFEGMPIVLLEAMAMGKPIVSTAVGGSPEIIEHGENGFLLHDRNPNKLASLIAELLVNEGRRKEMGEKGRRNYRMNFTAEKMAEEYSNLYEKYLSSKQRE
jgi:glycosyltransferase involved in cell wall biosynthesis